MNDFVLDLILEDDIAYQNTTKLYFLKR